jgi:uncharacterized protein (DUF885 family)
MSDDTRNAGSELLQLNRLFSDEWEVRMQEDPWQATLCGDHRFNDRLPAASEADAGRHAGQASAFLDRLHAIDRAALPPGDQLNYDIFERELSNRLLEHAFGTHFMPVSRLSGFQINFPDLTDFTPFKTPLDYEHYIRRLNGYADFCLQNIELMRAGMRRGYVPARAALAGIEESIRSLLAIDPRQSVFYKPFQRFPASVAETWCEKLREEGAAAIAGPVSDGYRTLLKFMSEEYLPAARAEIAASALPDGAAYYAYCVRKFTSLDLTPEQVHATGLEEVRRIRAEMDATMRQTGFKWNFKEFLAFLRSEPRFYVDTPLALMKEVALIMKKVDGELPALFKVLPRTPYGLREIPAYSAPDQTSAYYMLPAGDGSTAGFYYVNTYGLKSRPLYEYEALSLHEAVPGHHLQLALQLEQTGVPQFRRFGEVTAFVEGWALYAERLGLEMGFYQDTYSNFGRLIFEMWRAARLVVDTGMHALGWTRQQAIDFMAENTALSLLNITNEVDRYIAWPGQALAYKTGELKIRELRRLAEQRLGTRFDVREFHNAILQNGGIPLDVLEAAIKLWIEGQER